jgi:hypothetical protein
MKTLTKKEFFTLDVIIEAMYAEPEFSDLDAADLFKQVNVKWPQADITSHQSLGGIITQLQDKGIIEMEDWDMWNADEGTYAAHVFIHLAPAYYYLHPKWKGATEVPQANDVVMAWSSHNVTTEEPTRPSTATYYQVIELMHPYGPLNVFRTRDEALVFADSNDWECKVKPMIVEL